MRTENGERFTILAQSVSRHSYPSPPQPCPAPPPPRPLALHDCLCHGPYRGSVVMWSPTRWRPLHRGAWFVVVCAATGGVMICMNGATRRPAARGAGWFVGAALK